MKRLFLINDSLANQISYFHLILFLASLPFDFFYSHLILMSLGVHTIIQYKKEHESPVFSLRNLILVLVFAVTALSTIYSINKPAAFNEWGKQAAIVVLPLLFCFSGLDIKKYRPNLLLAFSLVCTATVFYLFADALRTIRFYHFPLTELFTAHFTNQNFSEPIQMHATFFSMQLAIALMNLMVVLAKEKATGYRAFYALCIGLLAAGMFQLGAKSVIACMLSLLVFAVPFFLVRREKRLKFVIGFAALMVIPIVFVLRSATLRERYVTELRADLSHRAYNDGVEPRLVRWDAAMGLIAKKPIAGYGAGTEIGLLQDVFYNKKIYHAYLNKLNVHSEYLSFLIKSGIIGLLVYLLALAYGFRKAIQNRDLLLLTFIAIIACVSISENLLDVDKGILFYAFFFSFFLFSADERKSMPNDNLLPFVATNQPVMSSSMHTALSPDHYVETVY